MNNKCDDHTENSLNNFKKYQWIAFFIIFISAIVYSIISDVQVFWGDAEWYWSKADTVFAYGFNLLNFPKTYRGYFFCVLVVLFKFLFSGFWGWRVLSSVMMAACFSFSLPYVLHSRGIRSLRELIGVCFAFGVFMWIWGDFMQYPLSDFAAAFFFLSGAALLKSIENEKPIIKMILLGFCSGICFYAAYNTRASYLYGVIFVSIIYAIENRKKLQKLLVVLFSIAAGVILVAIPQSLINYQYEGSYSPKVPTENYTVIELQADKEKDLESIQIYWGLLWERFEGYIGDLTKFPAWAVYYDDPTGTEIIERENLTIENFRMTTLLKRFLKYPLDLIGIYIKHAVSLMTPSFRQTYITNMFVDKGSWIVISIWIWLFAGYGITEQIRKKGFSFNILWIFGLCIPSLLQLFGAPEIRFFIMIYLLAYYYVFAGINYKDLWKSFKSNWLQPLLFLLIIFCLWISLYGEILTDNRVKTLLINDRPGIENVIDTEE